ncbi:MAG: cyclic nucleotide-binding domain-containing protein [Chitinivibrionales bacterium]|nr:cyclic nucleotide-binding domain-containing protein [Chitinivibrionales bacterium]MBD3356953.1 cyclic nucleotide-binding domain-containing protein [Chitinivibrionales bacterium]
MPTSERSKLKAGRRPVQLNTRNLKAGEVLFEEGTTGRELYIVQEGRLGVYKKTTDEEIELAVLEKNAMIGEMSLLDHLPRSATIRAVEDAAVLEVNEGVFHAGLRKAPIWLSSIIKIVVSRLRDANKRADHTVLRDKERGIVSLILLLLPKNKYEHAAKIALSYDLLIVEAYYICRLKKKDIHHELASLAKRGIVSVVEDGERKKHICMNDLEVLKLFFEYLTFKSRQRTFRELTIPDDAIAILDNIAYIAQKSGNVTEDGTILSRNALLEDLSDKNPEHLQKHLVDLRRLNLINLWPSEDDMSIIFRPETLSRIKKIREWLPKFEMEVS